MKRCSTSYITRDMQSKITMRYHYKSIRVALANKGFGQHQCRPGRGETGTLIHCWWERKVLHWKAIWRFLTKLNMFLPYQPWYLPKGVKKLPIFPNKILHMSVYNSFIHNYQILANCQSLPQAELFVRQRERPGLHSQAVAWPPRRAEGIRVPAPLAK